MTLTPRGWSVEETAAARADYSTAGRARAMFHGD